MTDDIRKAFVTHFLAQNFFPSRYVAHENVRFERPSLEPWFQLTFTPTAPTQAELGVGVDRVDGIFQIDLNYLVGTGSGVASAMYDTIRNSYRQAVTLQHNGQTVTIRSCGRSPGRIVDNNYRVSLTVFWYAFI